MTEKQINFEKHGRKNVKVTPGVVRERKKKDLPVLSPCITLLLDHGKICVLAKL